MNTIKIAVTILILVQLGLIGLSVFVIAGGLGEPSPIMVAMNAVLICVNVLFGAVNVRTLCR